MLTPAPLWAFSDILKLACLVVGHTQFFGPFELWGRNFGELATLKGRGVPEGRTAYTLTVEQNGQAGDRQDMIRYNIIYK